MQGYVSKLDEVAGTFAWAAPELLMGGRCSDKVDIYSFGVVLWELATCERPQRGAMRDVRWVSPSCSAQCPLCLADQNGPARMPGRPAHSALTSC